MFQDIIHSALHKPPQEEKIRSRRLTTSARFTSDDTLEGRLKKFTNELFVRSARGHFLAKALSSDAGQQNFMSFMKVHHSRNIAFLLAVENLKELVATEEFLDLAKEIAVRYFRTEKGEQDVSITLPKRQRVTECLSNFHLRGGPQDIITALNEAEEDVLDSLAEHAFDEWTKANPEFEVPEDTSILLTEEQHPEIDVNTYKRLGPELMKLKNTWLYHLLHYVDRLPKVAVSLSTASRDLPGFPLIHVNKTFEESYGYTDRTEWFGRNCRFLQHGRRLGHHAEKDAIAKMSEALRRCKPVTVIVSNFNKDGKPFRNHVSLVPIFHHDGFCAYYLCFSFDMLGTESCSIKKNRIVDELIEAIPHVWP